MRTPAGRPLLVVVALLAATSLLAAAPATRPSDGRFLLAVSRTAGARIDSRLEVTVDVGRPFSVAAQVGPTTVTADGTLTTLGRVCHLHLRYQEATADAHTGGVTQRVVSTTLEFNLGQHADLAGTPEGRLTVTLSPAADL